MEPTLAIPVSGVCDNMAEQAADPIVLESHKQSGIMCINETKVGLVEASSTVLYLKDAFDVYRVGIRYNGKGPSIGSQSLA